MKIFNKVVLGFAAFIMTAGLAFGQAPAFNVTTGPVLWRIGTAKEAATDAVGTLKVSQPKPNQIILLRTDNFVAPNPGVSLNTGGVAYAYQKGIYQVSGNIGFGGVSSTLGASFGANFGAGLNLDFAKNQTFSWQAVEYQHVYGRVADGSVIAKNSDTLATAIKISF